MVEVTKLSPEEWRNFSESAHLMAFAEKRDPEMDRISFALFVGDSSGPLGFITCREFDSESLYIPHGGATPLSLGTSKSYEAWSMLLSWIKEHGYKRVSMLVKNTNKKMIGFVYKEFDVIGIRNFKGEIYLEYLKEF